MRIDLLFKLAFNILIVCLLSPTHQTAGQKRQLSGILIETTEMPAPVKSDHKLHLLYELHLTNFGKMSLELTRLDVFADQLSQSPLVSYDKAYLEKWSRRPGVSDNAANQRLIGGGEHIIIFLNLVTNLNPLPASLQHRIFFKDEKGTETIEEGARATVRRDPPITISAPLRGSGWLAINALGAPSHHRLSVLPYGGKIIVPQRYAIDWIKLGAQQKPFNGNWKESKSYYGYGAELLAVANATVSDLRDGFPDGIPFQVDKSAIPFEDATGDHVLLDLGGGRFALYAHLQPGSIRVKIGERVRPGQVIGRLGNSGASDAPHLHFHLVDANSPLIANGLPYTFTSFVRQGKAESFDALMEGKGINKPSRDKPDRRVKELPADLEVVDFP